MTVSPAQRAQRQAAGKRSGQSRAGHTGASATGDPNAAMPITADPEVDKQLADYIALAGKPVSWPDVKNCEQVRAEIYRTRAAARADRIESGALITREVARARDERAAQAFREGIQSINELLTRFVPADRLLEAQKAGREWTENVLTKVSDAITPEEDK